MDDHVHAKPANKQAIQSRIANIHLLCGVAFSLVLVTIDGWQQQQSGNIYLLNAKLKLLLALPDAPHKQQASQLIGQLNCLEGC